MSLIRFGASPVDRSLAGGELPVTFENDGEQLVGMLHLPDAVRRRDCPAVTILHGYAGTRFGPHRLNVKMARELARAGIIVLRFDFRGSGDSAGDFADMTPSREVSDAQRSLDALASLDGADPARLGALGHSLGGGIAATLAGLDARVRSLVLWAPISHDPPETIGAFIALWEERPNAPEPFVEMGGYIHKETFFVDAAKWSRELSDILPRYAGPVMILHGTGDETVPVEHARRLYDLYASRPSTARTEIDLIPEADHVFNLTHWQEYVIRHSVQFLTETLEPSRG